ncbi:(E,E)-geranyllinalool synthase [Morus notabilis]|uniref:(E,E)-geranyllinalool synthase n=1 Tax=Morus notabilis TaxID=981085 RepID=W9RD40_9ROSA|nr:(E,E)-geranyllinalool synthase [Morus notabilis]
MELQLSAISDQVKAIKETMFTADVDPYSLVAPSAYDTAWLAMIPADDDSHKPFKPMFEDCLNWVLNNQNELGFWGECDGHGNPTIECLSATLACIIALRRWNVGTIMINKGLAYIQSSNAEKLLKEVKDHCPRWFAIVFPGMLQFCRGVYDLKIEIEESAVSDIFSQRQLILETEGLVDSHHYPPLLSYMDALPSCYNVEEGDIIKHLSDDGSLFQSPSATAQAFLATGNEKCLAYLQSLAQRYSKNGVPGTYPIDEDLIKLCIINHVQRLGLAEHFMVETEKVLEKVHKNYILMNRKPSIEPYHSATTIQLQLLKDCLAFRLLRMHGYKVSPRTVCWFLYNEEVRDLIEKNFEYFSGVLLNVYRATDLMFPTEFELPEARTFARKLIEKSNSLGEGDHRNPFCKLIEHELSIAWMARLDHLEHRLWIEESANNALWRGKSSFQRWSKDRGLSAMGFGREKTTYCYFAVAASCSLPYDSHVRLMVAKSAILITVADDFFDMKGRSLNELRSLIDAIKRWNPKGLCGDGKIIFNALDNLVNEMATEYFKQEGSDITSCLRDIWYETFLSWLVESEWGSSDSIPSMDEYLKVGMISIGTHTTVLPASCYLEPSLPISKLRPPKYEPLTKLLMIISRLLNDMQSYKKEKDEGTPNSVLLHLRNNPEANIEEAISYVGEMLNKKKEEFLEHVLMDDLTDLPKECRHLHLSCLKVFQMFYNSSNRYDSDTEMLDDIAKAIYIPPHVQASKNYKLPGLVKALVLGSFPMEANVTKCSTIKLFHGRFGKPPKNFFSSSVPVRQRSVTYGNVML